MTLLLEAGFGHDSCSGVWFSLRSDNVPTYAELYDGLWSFSCYPPAIPKIYECLKNSGRYDCVVQQSWIESSKDQLVKKLQDINVEVVFDSEYMPTRNRKPWRFP